MMEAALCSSDYTESRKIGSFVLMPMLFNNGYLERTSKRTRVKIEPPVGKYSIYSQKLGKAPFEVDNAYIMSASGKLVFICSVSEAEFLTETAIDKFCADNIKWFNRHMQSPDEWVSYESAAFAGRIQEAEAHNAPIRAAREAEELCERTRRIVRARKQKEDYKRRVDASVKAIETALAMGDKFDVERVDEGDYYNTASKNPLLELFRRQGVELPLATQGWINKKLLAAQLDSEGTCSVWLKEKGKMTDTFEQALRELKRKIELGV